MRSIGLAALALAALVAGRPGGLDPSFGSGGKVVTVIDDGATAQAIALQRDGKLVVAGFVAKYGSNSNFEVARYTARGRLDRRFGQGGKVATDFGAFAYAHAVKIQPDGKIVVAGVVVGSSEGVAVARYRPDGSLDSSFGAGGKVLQPGGGFALALQRDGKIVVGGEENRGFAVYRLEPDGSLDAGFGMNGEVTTPFEPYSAAVRGLAIQPDGKIVAVGNAAQHERDEWAIARYNPDGSLDPTFGSGGKVTILGNALSLNGATAVALQGKKRILVAGTSLSHVALAGFRPNGALDPGFGVNQGVTTLDATSTTSGGSANAIRLQRDGKIVIAGEGSDQGTGKFVIARFDRNGIPDPSFSGDGSVTTSLSSGEDGAYGLVIQRDGKLVAAGAADENGQTGGMIALVRYLASPSCTVPSVRSLRLAAARRALIRAHCSLGRVTLAFSSTVQEGRVISQRPGPGALRPERSPVRLVVSRGRR
jgi:uncharacterized delta-60 repeat protein